MIDLVRYTDRYKQGWDEFVRDSKNGTFLFCRDYMEYHADRFTDHSLLFYRKGRLVALLPASEAGREVHSHGGLTYGGIISGASMKAEVMLEVFEAMMRYYKEQGFRGLMYKAVPHIYHQAPAEEDLYALLKYGAALCRRDVWSVVALGEPVKYSTLRRRKLRQAEKLSVTLAPSAEWGRFMRLEQELLAGKYSIVPAHTAAEMAHLAAAFPQNIKLYTTTEGGELLAGIVIYETEAVAHCQYIGTTARGREEAALDLLLHWLLTEVYPHKNYFSFGSSRDARYPEGFNPGLVRNKESYGARTLVQDFYELPL